MADQDRDFVRDAITAAVAVIAHQAGAEPVVRRLIRADPGSSSVLTVAPAPGMQAALRLERAARAAVRGYIRDGRENGMSWHEIGTALGTGPDEAFSYAAGGGTSFAWRCGTCGEVISDRGIIGTVEDNERGHADDCARSSASGLAWAAWATRRPAAVPPRRSCSQPSRVKLNPARA